MAFEELPLHDDTDETGAYERPRRTWLWATVALALVAAIVAAVFVRRVPETQVSQAPGPTGQPSASVPRGSVPLGPGVEPIDLPPLEETDPLVRKLVGALSSRPEVAAWLATDGLIRNFVTALENVSEGRTPARHLKVLAPREPFRTVQRGDRVVVDPASYRRYDGLAQAVAALDANGVARLYSTLKPGLADAYRELGHPDGNIDAAVEKAITHLLDTPVVGGGDRELTGATVSYRYADPRLERASAAQKQLLRMGPANQALIQEKLREIAAALGMESGG
ncbi:MAG: DUF3014 domain-containing protein [Vicinamibacterales bacterium]